MSEDIVGQIKDIKGRTWQEAFYIQTKAFLEKNSEHLKEIERLKAEVERLKLEVFAFDRTIKQASCHYDNRLEDIRQLQAQVERLTKAGDELWEFAKLADTNAPKARRKALKDWNAAKEGKQP
jgi:predicted nuclease with TOPRIM domain